MSTKFSLGLGRKSVTPVTLLGIAAAVLAALTWNYMVEGAAPKDRPRGAKRRAAETEGADADSASLEQSGSIADRPDGNAADGPPTLRDVIAFAVDCREAVRDVKDYTATFSKSERIGNKLVQQEMDMKFRTKPFSVYFKYLSNNERGRQAIYVNGKNSNNLLIKEAKGLAGALGAIPLRLDDPRVKAENLYPVTHVGIANMLDETIKEWEHDLRVEGHEVEVQFFPNAKVKGVPCQAIQVTHLKRLKDIKYYRNRIYFDKATKLPIRGERYAWPRKPGEEPPLLEDYKYHNLKTNVGLTDADFTPAKYGF